MRTRDHGLDLGRPRSQKRGRKLSRRWYLREDTGRQALKAQLSGEGQHQLRGKFSWLWAARWNEVLSLCHKNIDIDQRSTLMYYSLYIHQDRTPRRVHGMVSAPT
jgi:hypothetical protein